MKRRDIDWLVWPTMIVGFILNYYTSKLFGVSNETLYIIVPCLLLSLGLFFGIDSGVRRFFEWGKTRNEMTAKKAAVGYGYSWHGMYKKTKRAKRAGRIPDGGCWYYP